MKALLTYAAVLAVSVGLAIPASGQEPSDDPFGGGFPISYSAEIFAMGTQNDSLHGWGFDWLSDSGDIFMIGTGSFPESYNCGDIRDIAKADFNGDYLDELVVVWNRDDGGVFIGIPTIDSITMEPDPGDWHEPDPTIAPGVLYATDTLAELIGEIRVAAGNFCADRAMEFVLAYLNADSTVTLSVFDVDTVTLIPMKMATISDQDLNTGVATSQQVGKINRFDLATGDFNGDGLDEILLVVNDPDQSPATVVMVDVYKYDTLGQAIDPVSKIPFTANDSLGHTCLRRLMVTTGNFDADLRDEISIMDRWADPADDTSRVGTLHILKLNPDMTAIDGDTQDDILTPVPHWPETGLNDWPFDMTIYNGELIAGGRFTTAGGDTVNHIARWDGLKWHALGSGVDSSISCMAVYYGGLFAAGNFTTAGGVSANRIARWNGTSWQSLGGLDNRCLDLMVHYGDLIVCGFFHEAGGVTAHYIAQWDGGDWSAVCPGLSSWPCALTVYNGDIIAGGNFTTASGNTVNHIARWNGSSWLPLGDGLDNIPWDLTVYDGKLIAGGAFTTAGGEPASKIAVWDGTTWDSLGSGMNNSVLKFATYNGELIAAGNFTTAGGVSVNGIARWDGSSWSPLGTGMTDPSGAEVRALTVDDNLLFAGGRFSTAGGVSAKNIAQWDGSTWYPITSYGELPMDITAGNINQNKPTDSIITDELFITACRENAGRIEQYVRGYAFDTSSVRATLCLTIDTTVVFPMQGGKTPGDQYTGRRTMALGDVTGEGQVDLAMLLSDNTDTIRIEVMELYADAIDGCVVDSLIPKGSWATDSDNLSELVLADLDTVTIWLGKPTYYHKTDILQPLVVLNTPPIHFDVLKDTVWDINFRYSENPDNCETYSVYQQKSGYTLEMSTEAKKDWGVSSTMDMSVGGYGFDVKAHLGAEYGEQFSETDDSGQTIEFTATVTTGDDDQIYATQVDYDIWEYPVMRGGVQLDGGGVMVVSPVVSGDIFSACKNPDREQVIPNHEVENVLSYPRYDNLTDNPLVASENVLTKGNTGFVTDEYPWSASWAILQTDFVTEGVEEEWNAGLDVGASVKAGGSYYGFDFGVEVGVDYEYDKSELQTYKTTVTDACSLGVYLGCINTGYGVCNYTVTPYAYWGNNGALVLDYITRPMVAGQGEDPTWWQTHYDEQDPALVLPWRLDDVKGEPLESEESRYKTREIMFHPERPNPGTVVTILARVHNFGLEPITDPVGVSFYIGDPDNGGQLIYGTGGDSIFYTPAGILPQCDTFVTADWQLPDSGSISGCQRIWALVDPLDEISPEVHDNNGWATNNKGWKLLYVNTDDICPKPDGDDWVDPAYRCHSCGSEWEWDNCPDVYNPEQTDSDGDGIGDACEEVVYVCGDPNNEGNTNILDITYLIAYLYKGGPVPQPDECVGDVNGTDNVNILDITYLIAFLYKGGPEPVEDCCSPVW